MQLTLIAFFSLAILTVVARVSLNLALYLHEDARGRGCAAHTEHTLHDVCQFKPC